LRGGPFAASALAGRHITQIDLFIPALIASDQNKPSRKENNPRGSGPVLRTSEVQLCRHSETPENYSQLITSFLTCITDGERQEITRGSCPCTRSVPTREDYLRFFAVQRRKPSHRRRKRPVGNRCNCLSLGGDSASHLSSRTLRRKLYS